MAAALSGFLALAVVIALGWLTGWCGLLGPGASVVLSRLAFFVATPALLFRTLAEADVTSVLTTALVATAGSAVLTALMYAALARVSGVRPAADLTVGALASSYVNAGNLGIPVAVYVLGDASYVAPVLLFQVLVMAPIGLGIMASSPRGEILPLRWWQLLRQPIRTPVVLGSALGLLVSAAGVSLPALVLQPVDLVAALAVPAALLSYGMSLHGAPRPAAGDTAGQVWSAVALKTVVMPLAAYSLGRWAVDLDGRALLAVTVTSALPTAQNVFVYASAYDRSMVVARDVVLLTTLLSVPVLVTVAVVLSR